MRVWQCSMLFTTLCRALLFQLSVKRAIFELSAESGGTLFYRGALFAAREMNVDSSIVREGVL